MIVPAQISILELLRWKTGVNMKYEHFETLKKNSDFKNVYNKKKSFSDKYLVMYISRNGTDTIRLGVSVSKKVGNSIVRHRLARLIRESFRLESHKIEKGLDIVVIARTSLKDKGYNETHQSMVKLCKHFGIYNEENLT